MAKKNAKIKGFGRLRRPKAGWRDRLARLTHYPVITAVAVVVTLALVRSSLPVTSAPVTPSATSKLTVYQGVAVIAPGEATDSVLELGNAGRDIASTGAIYFRPNSTNAGSYFDGSGSTQNLYLTGNLGVGVAGSSYPFVVGRDVDGQVYGARFQNMSTGAAAYIRPLSFLRRNAANTTTMEWFWEMSVGDIPELQLWRVDRPDGQPAGWSNPVSFKYDGATYFNSGNVGIGNVAPSSRLVVNRDTTNNGGANDAIATIANTTGSAIYAQQDNSSGWAGYFSGNVNITGSLTVGGVTKPMARVNVCQVSSSTCVGQYIYTEGTTKDTLKYWYHNFGTGLLASVGVYSPCSGSDAYLTRTTVSSGSSFEVAGCTNFNGEYVLSSGGLAYGAAGQYCRSSTASSGVQTDYQRSSTTGGACNAITSGPVVPKYLIYTPYGPGVSPQYELR